MIDALKSADSCLESTNLFLHSVIKATENMRENPNEISIDKIGLFNDLINLSDRVSDIYHGTASFKNGSDNSKKYILKLQEALNRVLVLNKNLEDSKNEVIKNVEKSKKDIIEKSVMLDIKNEENRSLKEQIVILKDSILVKENEVERISRQFQEIDKKNSAVTDSNNDLQRLRAHLVETEERYTIQIKELEDEKRKTEIMVQNMSVELNRTKTNLAEARTKYERHIKVLNEQLEHVSQERDGYITQVIQLSASTENNKQTIEFLNESLIDLQKDFDSQLNLLSDNYNENIRQLEHRLKSENEEIVQKIKSEHSLIYKTLTQENDNKINELTKENQLLKLKTKKLEEMTNLNPNLDEDENLVRLKKNSDKKMLGLQDKILVKNLVIAYSKLPNQHKPFAWRVLCDVLGIEAAELAPQPQQSALSWIPIVNRFVVGPTLVEEQPSLSQLFVDYLEEESKKISVLDPYVPPISTDELVDLVSRHQNSSL